MMKKTIGTALITVSMVALSACAHTSAQSTPDTMASKAAMAQETFNVKTISCWDVLTVAEEDLNMAMMLLYGYMQGASGQTEQSSESIEAAFTSAFAYCEANPESPAITGFK